MHPMGQSPVVSSVMWPTTLELSVDPSCLSLCPGSCLQREQASLGSVTALGGDGPDPGHLCWRAHRPDYPPGSHHRCHSERVRRPTLSICSPSSALLQHPSANWELLVVILSHWANSKPSLELCLLVLVHPTERGALLAL